jgi:DNA-damage-inducible protein J
MTTLNVRIDEKIKKQAGKTLTSIGLDMSSAIKIFLNQVIHEEGLPFVPTKNAKLLKAKWDKEVIDIINSGKGFASAKEMHNHIMGR